MLVGLLQINEKCLQCVVCVCVCVFVCVNDHACKTFSNSYRVMDSF